MDDNATEENGTNEPRSRPAEGRPTEIRRDLSGPAREIVKERKRREEMAAPDEEPSDAQRDTRPRQNEPGA